MGTTDADLVARCLEGEPGAFQLIYDRHAGRLYNLAYRMVGNAHDAEDLLQEIFLVAYRKLGSFKGESALATWMYRLGMNQCLDHLRSKGVKMTYATDSMDADAGWVHQPITASLAAGSIARIDLERAIAQLPPGCRAAFLLHDVEGLEHGQVALALGIAEGTSKSQVHKARMKLRELLGGPSRPPGESSSR